MTLDFRILINLKNQMRHLITDLQGRLLALLADLALLTTVPDGAFTEAAYNL